MTLCIQAVWTKELMCVGFLGGGGATRNDLFDSQPTIAFCESRTRAAHRPLSPIPLTGPGVEMKTWPSAHR